MAPSERELLSVDDAQILGLESDAIKGHTGKVIIVAPGAGGGRLDPGRLRARAAERIGPLRRLRQRVERPQRAGDRPAWVEDPDIDLDWHVSEAEVAEPLDDGGFRELAGELLAERLDHERPLWRLDVVPLTDDRTAVIGRIHHAMADGVSAIALSGALLWDEPSAEPSAPAKPSPSAEARPKDGEQPPTGPQRAEEHPRRAELLRVPGALRRELRPGSDTALDRHIGPSREVAWRSFGLKRLKGIGHAAGTSITVNDVVLAAVAGGLRRWLDGGQGGRVRVQVPVSLHHRDEGEGQIGNRDSFLNVDLPLAEPDALIRLRAISSETSERKLDHDAETLYDFFHAVGRFKPLRDGITRLTTGPREFALSVSNVPGPRERPSILGHEIAGFASFAEPADRHALRVSVVSLGGELAFGLCSDPEAIADLGLLAAALDESVVELERACSGA
jgi:WS/DGAT/MGAT family acyltransferase